MRERLQRWFRTERKKVGAMTKRQAAEYIWQYYKLWIIGFVCLVWFTTFAVTRYRMANRDHWLYITFANTRASIGDGSELWQGYVDYTGFDMKKKDVVFNNEAYFDYAKDQARGNVYYEVFVGFTDAGVLDAVTMNPGALTSLGQTGRLLDLSREECASIREKYGDRFLYTQPFDEDYGAQQVPVGIDISDSILVTKWHAYTEGAALGIGANSGNIDSVELFLDYIFQEGQP